MLLLLKICLGWFCILCLHHVIHIYYVLYRVEDETPESYVGAPEGEAPEFEPAEEDTTPAEGKHPCILTPL